MGTRRCTAGFRSGLCPVRVKPGHCGDVCYTTAFAPKADFDLRSCDVADVPFPDTCTAAKSKPIRSPRLRSRARLGKSLSLGLDCKRVSFFARCALAPSWAAMLVRTIMVIACDAANAERLSSGPSIPIHVVELSAVTKLLQVRVTENVSVPDDADTGQLAYPVFVKFRSLYSNFTGCHIGLWRKHGGSELSLVENAKINRANHGPNFHHIDGCRCCPRFQSTEQQSIARPYH